MLLQSNRRNIFTKYFERLEDNTLINDVVLMTLKKKEL